MLYPAQQYEEELKQKMIGTWYDDRNKYWHCARWHEIKTLPSDTYNQHDFVSVNQKDNVIIGMISYSVDRDANYANDLSVINFDNNNKIIFLVDLRQAIKDIFYKFNFNKLVFSVVIGNPAEKMYDRFIQEYNGRVVGIYKEHTRLLDGCMYDMKIYEIFKRDYISKGHFI